MKRKRKVANTPIDPTAAGVPLVLAGTTYHLCMDLGALAEAESHFIAKGHEVNVLVSLPRLNLTTVYTVFPCAIHKHHPEISFEDAQGLINPDNVWTVAMAIKDAWDAASVPPVKGAPKNPPPP